MKKWHIAFVLILVSQCIIAQTKISDIMLDKKGKLYLQHKVAAKESFSGISKMYNVSNKSIASYNNLEVSKSLPSGKQIKIPLNDYNFWQQGKKGEDELLVPLYVKVTGNSTVKDLSKKYKADKSSIKSWNSLKKDDIKKGSRLIVGYLKVEKNTPLAKKAVKVKTEGETAKKEKEDKKGSDANEETETTKIKDKTNSDKKTGSTGNNKITPVDNPKTEPVVESKKAEEPVAVYEGQGFFKKEYEQQLQASSESTTHAYTTGVFKSTSGWNDGKFYIILNDVPKGTIVLVKNIESGKFIYAKVLTSVNEAKPQSKEEVLISNAAAAQLEVKNNTFSAELFWSVE